MSRMKWDEIGKRFYETGVSKGVLALMDAAGTYPKAVPWSGLTKVSESPSGAEETKLYADNIKYLGLMSAEDYGATIECLTYPDEFNACDGASSIAKGITVGQQDRAKFAFSYQSKKGNDVSSDAGYIIYLIYGAQAKPSNKDHETVNESPAATTLSYEISTTPVEVGVDGIKPTACLKIDSTLVDKTELAAFEKVLYGDETKEPSIPLPSAVLALFPNSKDALTTSENK